MKEKYDTNPLDPEFARKTDERLRATDSAGPSPAGETATGEQPRPRAAPDTSRTGSEAPTRRYDERMFESYPSINVPPGPAGYPPPYQPPAPYRPPEPARPLHGLPAPARSVDGLGISEKIATTLPYAPFYIGLVAALVELIVVPRREVRTRFHASQGLALQLAITAIILLFKLVGLVTAARFGGTLFWLASEIFLIVSMVRVWRGRAHHIPPLDEATGWLNEHIDSRRT